MSALPRPEMRLRRMRATGWLVAPILTFPLSYLMAMIKAPDAPAWLPPLVALIATPVAGVLLASAIATAASELLLARLGTPEERRRHLAAAPNRFAHAASRAAVALEAGELGQAVALLDGVAPLEQKSSLVALVTQRKVIATGGAAAEDGAVDALLAWRGGPRIGLHAERARYHAFVLASALAARAPDDPRVLAAARRLRADRDFEVRAYATWLAADADESADELLGGAALARAAGREPLARALELRAARASSDARAPYRAGG